MAPTTMLTPQRQRGKTDARKVQIIVRKKMADELETLELYWKTLDEYDCAVFS